MCGIAGIYLNEGAADADLLQRMAGTLGHRGPDDSGVHLDGRLGLAHTRLSIIDVAGGHQPLFARNGELALVANGEIYNHVELRAELEDKGHRFTTHSDCETILYAYLEYGDGFLDHLVGMFAFALYDRAHGRLILARDRLGIKPLYYTVTPQGVAFASEVKTLLKLPDLGRQVHAPALVEYVQNQFNSGRQTILEGVKRLLPGEVLEIEADHSHAHRRYWSPTAVKPAAMTLDDAKTRFDALMETVMHQHMRTDVPFGLFLSGGVDSSILLALLTRYHDHPVRSFSVGFPGTTIIDELPNAELLARKFASDHTVLEPDEQAMLQRLPYAVWAADDLMQDFANLPTSMLAEAAGRELKVVFTGEGGDEVFAGYGRYRMSGALRALRNLVVPGSGGFRIRGVFRGRWPRRIYGPDLRAAENAWREPFVTAWRECPAGWSDLQRMQYTDLVTALPDNLLVKVDRMLMGWGMEGRVPFLDHRVVEFGLAMPDDLKVQGRQGKAFLKHWAAGFLPEEALWRRKRGFAVPVGDWLQGQFLDRLEALLPKHAAIQTWFDPTGINHLFRRHRAKGDMARHLWTLMQFAIWHQLFVDGEGGAPPALQDPLELLG